MTVGELKIILNGLGPSDDEREILMSSDPEGNEIMDVHQLLAEPWTGAHPAFQKPPIVIWPMHRR